MINFAYKKSCAKKILETNALDEESPTAISTIRKSSRNCERFKGLTIIKQYYYRETFITAKNKPHCSQLRRNKTTNMVRISPWMVQKKTQRVCGIKGVPLKWKYLLALFKIALNLLVWPIITKQFLLFHGTISKLRKSKWRKVFDKIQSQICNQKE